MTAYWGVSQSNNEEEARMAERLQSTDALEADIALRDVINGYIDDLHSNFCYASPYAGNVRCHPT